MSFRFSRSPSDLPPLLRAFSYATACLFLMFCACDLYVLAGSAHAPDAATGRLYVWREHAKDYYVTWAQHLIMLVLITASVGLVVLLSVATALLRLYRWATRR